MGRRESSSSGPSARGCWPAGCSPVRAPEDGQLATALAELRQLQTTRRRSERVRPRARADVLRRRCASARCSSSGSGEVADPATLEELQAALGADQALVAYVAAPTGWWRWSSPTPTRRCATSGPGDALRAVLGGLHADLDMAGSDLPDAFAAPVRRQLAARLAQLDALLVAPVADLVGDRRLVLTPVGRAGRGALGAAARDARPAGDGDPVGDLVAVPAGDAAAARVGRLRRRPAGRRERPQR